MENLFKILNETSGERIAGYSIVAIIMLSIICNAIVNIVESLRK